MTIFSEAFDSLGGIDDRRELARLAWNAGVTAAMQSEEPASMLEPASSPPKPVPTIHLLHEGDDLQKAIDAANPGDVIELDYRATFVGNFTLPNKVNDGLTIRGSRLNRLPERSRVSLVHSKIMPTIVSPNHKPAIQTDFGAHHYDFEGIEITTTHDSRERTHSNLCLLGWENGRSATRLKDLPHHIVWDRCYLHGTRTGNVRTGIGLNGNYVVVKHCHLNDFHEVGSDSFAIMAWNGAGPFLIIDNYLEASGENIMFGGADPSIPNLVPTDIEIVGNHLFKPLRWKQEHPTHDGSNWLVKNLLELKNARDVTIRGNILENSWVGGQIGYAVLFTVRNQNGSAPWSVLDDILFSGNIVRACAHGMSIRGSDDLHDSQQTTKIVIEGNYFYDIGSSTSKENDVVYDDTGMMFVVATADASKPVQELTIRGNTLTHARGSGRSMVSFSGNVRSVAKFVYEGNIASQGKYGFHGTGQGSGIPALNWGADQWSAKDNQILGKRSKTSPPDNWYEDDMVSRPIKTGV